MIKRNQPVEIVEYYENNKVKADDLADSFLQGVAYLMKV